MRRSLFTVAVLALACLAAPAGAGKARAKKPEAVRFAVLAHRFSDEDEAALQETVAQVGRRDYAFIVANGVKAAGEPCADVLYGQRERMLDAARDPVIVVLAGDDWTGCRNAKGRPNAIERLNRLREVFYPDARSLGRRTLEVNRLSGSAGFRGYAEYAHWQSGKVLFATLNLPAPNNNYRADAGRNSEYEDRAVANREWLTRLFRIARIKKLEGVVLFADADIYTPPRRRLRDLFAQGARDGFQDVRRLLEHNLQQFPGRVLLIDNGRPAPGAAPARQDAIEWRGRLGHVGVAAVAGKRQDWIGLRAEAGTKTLFALEERDGKDARD